MKRMMKVKIFLITIFLLILFYGVAGSIDTMMGMVSVPRFLLTVTKSGTGTGTVTSAPGAINCGATCSWVFDANTTVVLTPVADVGSMFNGWTGACTGIGACSVLMDANKTVDANFILFPKSDYLIGWYKFNEGAGVNILNYATGGSLGGGLLPNLTVVNNTGTFWTYLAGFGTSPRRDVPVDGAYAEYGIRAMGGPGINYTVGIFLRQVAPPSGAVGVMTLWDYQAACGGGANSYLISGSNFGFLYDLDYEWRDFGGVGPVIAPIPGYAGGEWMFFYILSNGTIGRVRTDGTRVVSGATLANWDNAFNTGLVGNGGLFGVGCVPTLGGEASYGDTIIYNFTTLTDAEWKAVYNTLRGRHGMAAPNGW